MGIAGGIAWRIGFSPVRAYLSRMVKGRDFVVIGLSPWHIGIGSNCKNIALQLSRHNRVLYVNMPLDRNAILRAKDDPGIRQHLDIIKSGGEDLVEIQPNLWVYYPHHILESINWIPAAPVFNVLNRINNRRLAADIRQATRRLGITDHILFNDNDIYRAFFLKELLHPRLYIYYSRDYLMGVDWWRKHGQRFEPKHIAKADIGVANSEYLADYLRQFNPNSYYIGQGCELSLFDAGREYALPEDMRGIAHPIVGYIGVLSSLRIDESVIRTIARERPHMSIVLVGPEDPQFEKSELHGLANVHFLGRKPMDQLAAYSAQFDVCINPQLLNPVTIGNYPLKIDEYLSMGKPAVATRTKAMSVFGDTVDLADKPEDYPALIDKALAEDNAQRRAERIAITRTHTWENSVEAIYAAIEKTLG
jgi:teichuronic acid biosynthesis glycosyltransferase TuaH